MPEVGTKQSDVLYRAFKDKRYTEGGNCLGVLREKPICKGQKKPETINRHKRKRTRRAKDGMISQPDVVHASNLSPWEAETRGS